MELKEVELRVEYDDGQSFVGTFITLRSALTWLKSLFGWYVISDVRIIPVYK